MTELPPKFIPEQPDLVLISQLADELNITWNHGDAAGYAQLFTSDAPYIAVDGTYHHGRQAIEQSHRELFATHMKGSQLQGHLIDGQLLSPETALVHRIGFFRLPGQEENQHLSIQTLLASKQADQWRFAAFHNTSLQATSW